MVPLPAYRLIGRVPGLLLVVIFAQFFGERSQDRDQLYSSSSREFVDQLACLTLGDVISKGQSSLQSKRCVGSIT